MQVLVSACLVGENCKYDGGNNHNKQLFYDLLAEGMDVVAVCPEVAGGLTIPRTPAERVGDKVLTKDGVDVTAQYVAGAEKACALAKSHGCKAAILKKNSPSCGCGEIYDGTFTGTLVKGKGVAAEKLKKKGLIIYNEDNYEKIFTDFMFED